MLISIADNMLILIADSVNADPVKGQNGSRGQHQSSHALLTFLVAVIGFHFLYEHTFTFLFFRVGYS